MENLLRVQTEAFTVFVIVILWFSGNRRSSTESVAGFLVFRLFLASTAAMLVVDAVSWQLDGVPGNAARLALHIDIVLYYALHSVPAALFILYSDFQVFMDDARVRKISRWLLPVLALMALVAISSPFTGLLYVLDEGNHYARGSAYLYFVAIDYSLIAIGLGLVIVNRRRVKSRVFLTLLAFPLPMVAAGIVQMLVFGLTLLWPSTALFLLMSSLNIENRRSKTDHLTGAANRRSLDEELERRLEQSKPGNPLCGLLLDLDDFKSINDRFGHEAGDRALEAAAEILLASVRADDLVARFGGDEFVVLFEGKGPVGVESLVARIEDGFRRHSERQGQPYRLAASIGRACRDRTEEVDAASFLAALDADMYARKRLRKGA